MGDEFSGVHEAICQYARAVQRADVDTLRSITFGALRERFSMEYAGVIAAQLACDSSQYGAITLADVRDGSIDSGRCEISATLNFERAAQFDVRFTLVNLGGRWLLTGAHPLLKQRVDWPTAVG